MQENNNAVTGGGTLQETCVDGVVKMASGLDHKSLSKLVHSLQDLLGNSENPPMSPRGGDGHRQMQRQSHRGDARPMQTSRLWGNVDRGHYHYSMRDYDEMGYSRGRGRSHRVMGWGLRRSKHFLHHTARDSKSGAEEGADNATRRSPPRTSREGAEDNSGATRSAQVEVDVERNSADNTRKDEGDWARSHRQGGSFRRRGRGSFRGPRRPKTSADAKADSAS